MRRVIAALRPIAAEVYVTVEGSGMPRDGPDRPNGRVGRCPGADAMSTMTPGRC